nr:hypothetical protein [Tanacetum cinerariifolium]
KHILRLSTYNPTHPFVTSDKPNAPWWCYGANQTRPFSADMKTTRTFSGEQQPNALLAGVIKPAHPRGAVKENQTHNFRGCGDDGDDLGLVAEMRRWGWLRWSIAKGGDEMGGSGG